MSTIVVCDRCDRQYDLGKLEPGQKARCLCGNVITVPAPRPHDAPMRHCANCGAPLGEEANTCDYCGGSVDKDRARFSLVCPKCFARLPRQARYCIQCAVPIRPQRIDMEERPDRLCPRCKKPLHTRKLETVILEECGECCGLWLSNDAFREVSRLKVEEYGANPLPERDRSERRLDPVVYLKCPACGDLMNRTNFGRRSGVIIDQCAKHGVWLDDEELERIARFIAEGGLAQARKVEAQELERRARRARSAARLESSSLLGSIDASSPSVGVLGFLSRLFTD